MSNHDPIIKKVLPNRQSAILWVLAISALLIFQSSQDVSVNKILYMTFFSITAISSFFILISNRQDKHYTFLIYPVKLAIVLGIYLTVLLLFYGASVDQIRDAIPYFLIVFATIIGQYLGTVLTVRHLLLSALVVSLLASLLTFTDWISRRGATDLVSKAGLASAALPALGFALAIWMSLYSAGWKRAIYTICGSLILVTMLATGNRTNFVLLFALIPIFFVRKSYQKKVDENGEAISRKSPILLIITVILVAGFAFFLIANLGFSAFLQDRLITYTQIFLSDASNDQSYLLRAFYYQLGFEGFMQNPLLGIGFNPFGNTRVQDTPFEGLAKIGILGTLLLSMATLSMIRASSKLSDSFAPIKRGFQGWLFVLLALVPFGTIWQDKGFSISVIYIISITQASLKSNEPYLDSDSLSVKTEVV